MNKKLILVGGEPRQGKTKLSVRLSQRHGYNAISLDHVYVALIREQYPRLYFAELLKYVGPHYDTIFNAPSYFPGTTIKWTNHIFQRDVVSDWCNHLLHVIRDALAENDRVVVEGYLLKDCMMGLDNELRRDPMMEITTVRVEAGRAHVGQEVLSFDQLIARQES